MKLSSDVRRCREELPEAARRRLPWLITAARGAGDGKPRAALGIVLCSPGLVRPVGATETALGSRDGLRDTR